MPQHVRQLHHVPGLAVKSPGEQVAEVVGEDLFGRDPRKFAEGFHLRPDLFPIYVSSASGEENPAGSDLLFSGVI